MAILETAEKAPQQGTLEAADSRLFYAPDSLLAHSLSTERAEINLLAEQMSKYGSTDEAETEQGILKQRDNLAILESLLEDVNQRIVNLEGWLMLAFQPNSFLRTAQAALIEDYKVADDEDRAVLFVPSSAITASSSNPQFYGTGHDTKPVINMRIQTSSDPTPPHNPYIDDEQAHLGRWVQISFERMEIGLLQAEEATQ